MANEFKVGAFTLIACTILGYMFFILNPDSFKRENQVMFYTTVDNASGIVVNTHVKTNGVIVGKVNDVKLLTNQTRIEISVNSDVKIPIHSQIAIKEKGLLGDVFIEIIRGSDSGVYINPNGFIPPKDDQMSMSSLIAIAGSIGQDIKLFTQTIAQVLGGEDGKKDFAAIVKGTRQLIENSGDIVAENRENIRVLVKNFTETSAEIRNLMANHEKNFDQIIKNTYSASNDLKVFAANIKDLVGEQNKEKLDGIINAFASTMSDVEVTAKNVRLVADKIEKGEGTLGKLISKDDTLSELEGAIKDVREILAPANKLKVEVDFHSELRTVSNVQHFFNANFRTRPDRFYYLGFTDSHENVREIVTEPLSVDDSKDLTADEDVIRDKSSRERIRTRETKSLRFNLQFAKRWRSTQLRFGLFESTGGFAMDVFTLSDQLKFSFEAFDWDQESFTRRTAHFKTYLSIMFLEHLYAVAGINDLTRYKPYTHTLAKDPDYFIGAGLNFDDEDLKAIFGTAALAL